MRPQYQKYDNKEEYEGRTYQPTPNQTMEPPKVAAQLLFHTCV